MKAVSDSTVLIGLAKIEKTDLLRDIFHKIYIPEAVFREVAEESNRRAGAKTVRDSNMDCEKKARKSAVRAGFKVMGLIGILIAAKRLGLITDIRTSIETLQREKFRPGEKIVNMALKQAGELM